VLYFLSLSRCSVTQYVEKDPATAATVIKGLVRSWPLSSSSKQITLLNELEEVLELAGPDHVLPVARPLFLTLAKCVGSTHFQVAERALFLWNNEALVTSGILSKAYASDVLPLLYTALTKNASGHWNTTVSTTAAPHTPFDFSLA
jgi:serine/threonine-protein phosphatase 2A regulatory subunit B'